MQFSLICVVFSLVFASVTCRDPSGSYCGTYLDSVTVKATVLSLTKASLLADVFGSSVSCPNETASYDASTGVIKLVDLTDPSDCVGKLLSSYGIDPSSLSLQYISSTNVIAVSVAGTSLTLSACTFRLYSPSGSYCGSYDTANIEVTVLSQSAVKLNATVDGYTIGCSSEAVDLDEASGSITFPDLSQPTDCLGAALHSLGVSTSSLVVTYNSVADTIHVQDDSVDVVLTKCSTREPKVLVKSVVVRN